MTINLKALSSPAKQMFYALSSRAKQIGERSDPICAVEGPASRLCRDSRPRLSSGAKLRRATATLCFALALTCPRSFAQTSPTTSAQKDTYAELSKAPKKSAARRNPLETDPDAVTAGAKLFDLHCAECHGELATGGKKAPSLRVDAVQQATPGTLFWLLTNGVVRRGMPVWSKLPEPQRWQLVAYIKSLSPKSYPGKASP